MNIGQMPRERVFRALERQQTAALAKGDEQKANQYGEDLAILRDSPGDTFYDIYKKAERRSERLEFLQNPLNMFTGAGVGAALGATGAGVGFALGAVSGGTVGMSAFIGGMAGLMVGFSSSMFLMGADDRGYTIRAAAERCSQAIAHEMKSGLPTLPEISRERILEQLVADKDEHIARGRFRQASQIEDAIDSFSRHSSMGLSELHSLAVNQKNEALTKSVSTLLSNELSAEEMRKLIESGDLEGLEFKENEVDLGDQSLPRK